MPELRGDRGDAHDTRSQVVVSGVCDAARGGAVVIAPHTPDPDDPLRPLRAPPWWPVAVGFVALAGLIAGTAALVALL